MSCNGKDLMRSCDVQPSPFYVMVERRNDPRVAKIVDTYPTAKLDWVQLEWCPRCGLMRIPFDARET